ncbi:U-box domain-containing protein 39 [Camellia lanceoleosa]|uniref:U-box domain-containing protein 39 n=1 Tax=Camellia lanceoleosa TaxID=1840588 RepID=A0ACC0IUP6_9ERIC|nr:U-box domain-containing protein 39 [Camellia lanceoleosa]
MCVQVCRHLGFAPLLPDGSNLDFSTIIPNLNLKSTILNWCDSSCTEHPQLPDYSSVETMVRGLMASVRENDDDSKIRVSERKLLKGVANSIFEDQEFVVKLKSLDVFEQEQGLIALRKLTRMKEEARVWG